MVYNINMDQENTDKLQAKKGRITIFTVVITAFITTFTGSALNLSIPNIGEEMAPAPDL